MIRINGRPGLAVAVAALVLLSACGGSQSTSSGAAVVKIGAVLPLTGSLAAIGNSIKAAYQVTAEMINGKSNLSLLMIGGGGLPHVGGGAKIELVFADSQGDPQIGATETERLISQEHVDAIIGAYNSAVTATASQVAERHGVPFLSDTSSDPMLTSRGFRYFFRTTPTESLIVPSMFSFVSEADNSVKTIGIMTDDSSVSQQYRQIAQQQADKAGYKVNVNVTFPAKATSLDNEIRKVKSADPDVLFVLAYSADAVTLRKAMQLVGYTPKKALMADDAGFVDPQFIPTLGPLANNIFTREIWNIDLLSRHPTWAKVNDKYKAAFGSDLNEDSARAVTGLQVLAAAIDKAGSTKPDAVRDALQKTNIPPSKLIVPWVGVKFDSNNQNTETTAIVVQIQNQKYRVVWPSADALVKPIWP